MKSVFLESKNISLRPLSKEDSFDDYVNWLNNQETTLFMGSGQKRDNSGILLSLGGDLR
ncbi:hypothetical protein KJ898_03915 [bacterium]|nr:hypothetical protein [bacterium]MBU2440567.1 hypothetical protein [bacterium]